jgi:hypothetical protein
MMVQIGWFLKPVCLSRKFLGLQVHQALQLMARQQFTLIRETVALLFLSLARFECLLSVVVAVRQAQHSLTGRPVVLVPAVFMTVLFLFRRLALTLLRWALVGRLLRLVVTAHLAFRVWILLGRLLLVAVMEQSKAGYFLGGAVLVEAVATMLLAS